MQAEVLEKAIATETVASEDDFSSYLKDALVRSVSAVYCFSVFSNKMSANDCLTSLKFTTYFQHLKLEPRSCVLNLE
jgi:hypothetical protein